MVILVTKFCRKIITYLSTILSIYCMNYRELKDLIEGSFFIIIIHFLFQHNPKTDAV